MAKAAPPVGRLEDKLEEWEDLAICKEHDTEIFFPEDIKSSREKLRIKKKAISVCNNCPVIEKCLEYAVVHHIPHGIWGGLDFYGRMRLKEKEPYRFNGKNPRPSLAGGNFKKNDKPSIGTGAKSGIIYA